MFAMDYVQPAARFFAVAVVCATSCLSLNSSVPDVLVVILASNEEHTLPTFFGGFDRLTYPKKQIGLWLRSDHNHDNTPHFLDVWLEQMAPLYHSISIDIRMMPKDYKEESLDFTQQSKETRQLSWPRARYETLIRLKEAALNFARRTGISYIWFLDTDAILTNPDTLQDLMAENCTVIAPLLQSMSAYSNFWGEMDSKGYYLRSSSYLDIVERELLGTHSAALVHSSVLIDLRPHRTLGVSQKNPSAFLTFRRSLVPTADNSSIPLDDIITFARSAQAANIRQCVTNKKVYGWILSSSEDVDKEKQELINLKIEIARKSSPLPETVAFKGIVKKPTKDSLGVDQVYLINLKRRADRRDRMRYCFDELGVRFEHFSAIDGEGLTREMQLSLNIAQLPHYRDPLKNRNMTLGEVGCFLSHFNVWKDIVSKNYRDAIIFEDDIHFEPFFRERLQKTLMEIRSIGYLELVYLGRKKMANASEPYLFGSAHLVQVDYSYWTLSYYVTRNGAQKLIDGSPLSKMVPVDEYIPIMFDRHPRSEWKEAFEPRTLRAASAYPLLVYPTHYTGETNYFSDTEDSLPASINSSNSGSLESLQRSKASSSSETLFGPPDEASQLVKGQALYSPTGNRVKSHISYATKDEL